MGKYVLFGAGEYGKSCLELLGENKVKCFVDNDPKKQGTYVENIRVLSCEEMIKEIVDEQVVITVAKPYYEQIKQQLEKLGIRRIKSYKEIQIEITKKKLLLREDYVIRYDKTIRWIKIHSVQEKGIINNTGKTISYPEVTGYYIPSLIRWGYRDLAEQYANWLMDIQKADGSWYDTDDQSAYIFDSAQILKGLLAIWDIHPDKKRVEKAIRDGADWILSCPSVVAFTKSKERIVGDAAKRQAAVNSDRTIFSIKRHMGTDYRKKIDGKYYTPQEISAFILMKLKEDAEDFLGQPVTDAVVTVPAYFTDAQRQATKDAGKIAGLNILRIINEPTSAALAYGLDNGTAQKVLVYDLGGGTFDVSVIDIGDNVIEVLATSGDNHLGGDDFDERIVNYLVEQFKISDGINLSKDVSAMQRLREEAEKAKKELSSSVTTNINLPFIAMSKDGPHHIDITLSRQTFDELTADLVDRTITPVENALHDAGLSKTDINMVLLVGGSTRIPAVADKVRQLMGKEPSRNLNPDECVALGAAVQGGKLGNQLQAGSAASEIILMDVTPMSLSIETMGGIASRLIERNTTIPTRHSQIFTTAGNFQTSVDIKVFQGERKFTRDNKLLGNFRLNGIKRAMAGVPQIEVTFDIDVNGIVNVSAKDLGTGREQSITITSSSNMTEEEIAKARWEAEVYSKQDEAYQSFIDIREDAVRTLNEANNALAANKKVWDKDKKKNVKAQIGHLGKLISKTPIDKLNEEKAASMHEASEAVKETLR